MINCIYMRDDHGPGAWAQGTQVDHLYAAGAVLTSFLVSNRS